MKMKTFTITEAVYRALENGKPFYWKKRRYMEAKPCPYCGDGKDETETRICKSYKRCKEGWVLK